jgi:beta-lactamase class A
MLRIAFVLFLNLLASLAFATASDSLPPVFRSLEKSFAGRLGFMARDLATGRTIRYAADEKFTTASTIKLPIMVEYFYQRSEGKIAPEQTALLADSLKVGGSGLLQYFSGNSRQKLIDAVMMMIDVSDNTATNMVLDALGPDLKAQLAAVNNRMAGLGLKNTRLNNRLMGWKTKTDSAESIRYGVGVSTPADMVLLLEKLYHRQLADSTASTLMLNILSQQFYNDLIPRYLPFETNPDLTVAHKTGNVTGVQVDVGLVLSNKLDMAIAVFTEQAQDRRDGYDNQAGIAIARASRLAWNYFTGDSGYAHPYITSVDWTSLPGGKWTRVFLNHAVYPHSSRKNGYTYKDRYYPYDPHYNDSSVVIVVPNDFKADKANTDLIVHFHGWKNDVLGVLEQFHMGQQLIASKKNAILVLAQGPYRASDSGGGGMEDPGGLQRMVQDVMQVLYGEKMVTSTKVGRVIITAHSGGFRPAIYAVARGGMQEQIREVFLFDAFYGLTEELLPWLKSDNKHRLRSIFTDHLAEEHTTFKALLKKNRLSWQDTYSDKARIVLMPTTVCHDCVIRPTFLNWLKGSVLENR